MADERPTLHIDSDWKRQAQEEKRRLAEEEAKRAAEQKASAAAAAAAAPPPGAAPGPVGGRGQRELPPPSFASLVQSLVTQALFYLGDIAPRGAQPIVDLDMAKHHIDTLAILDEKTKGNLTDDERHVLDAALYEVRMRYVAVASQFIS